MVTTSTAHPQAEPTFTTTSASGSPTRSRVTRWTPEQDAELRQLYAEGRTWAEIARTLNVSRSTATAHGHRLGCATRTSVAKAVQQSRENEVFVEVAEAEVVEEIVLPHRAVLATIKPTRRPEGGSAALPPGDPITWSLLVCHTPVLGNPPWPDAGSSAPTGR